MDSLDCKSQEVLYTMFEYPSLAKSKLILVGQSQIVDLYSDWSVTSVINSCLILFVLLNA